MKKLCILSLGLLFALQLFSQNYMTTAGLRFGTDWGLTVQQRIAENFTVEGILQSSLQREEVLLTAMVERHYPVIHKGVNLYFGGGLHKGWINEPPRPEYPNGFNDPLGITFVGGAEITLGRLNISYDLKPAVNLRGGERTFYTQSGLSVRYVLISARDIKKFQKKQRKKKRQKEGKGIRLGDDWKFWKKD